MLRFLSHFLMPKRAPIDPLIVILGATGTGKSQLAVDLALKYNGEIINGDAMQMYAGLPIITNKLSPEEQKGIPHHLLGVVGLDEAAWQVGMFRRNALRIMQEIRDRGKLPILVGGTHYYTQSLLFADELVRCPTELAPDEVSTRFPILDASTDAILARLREVDPIMADRWHPKDRRHIRRSLEIYLTLGKQASQVYKEQRRPGDSKELRKWDESFFAAPKAHAQLRPATLLLWVHAEPEILKVRLDARVDSMLRAGLLDEVRDLNEHLKKQKSAGVDVDTSRGVWISIGFREFQRYLDTSEERDTVAEGPIMTFHDALEQTKGGTRQYAKRQVRWIRSKLMAALLEAQAVEHLFVFDGSDLNRWAPAVSEPAAQITADFLAGAELPRPGSLSPRATELLDTRDAEAFTTRAPFRRECAVCSRTFVIEKEWLAHLHGRSHKRVVAKSLKRSQNQRYLDAKARSEDVAHKG